MSLYISGDMVQMSLQELRKGSYYEDIVITRDEKASLKGENNYVRIYN